MPILVVAAVIVLAVGLTAGFAVGTRSRRWCPRCGGGLQCAACPPPAPAWSAVRGADPGRQVVSAVDVITVGQ